MGSYLIPKIVTLNVMFSIHEEEISRFMRLYNVNTDRRKSVTEKYICVIPQAISWKFFAAKISRIIKCANWL